MSSFCNNSSYSKFGAIAVIPTKVGAFVSAIIVLEFNVLFVTLNAFPAISVTLPSNPFTDNFPLSPS